MYYGLTINLNNVSIFLKEEKKKRKGKSSTTNLVKCRDIHKVKIVPMNDFPLGHMLYIKVKYFITF
jgi:hypothetical protein